ncbi:PadR family transcriptional regulator [Mycobacterium sp.]|jgi:DNA-binding PadR family transcriptional regulator|uniref:PadR family transcriptional regulator n=1 Tax=Mycobacterium sp. TaxID=1785 RepID=UPI002D5B62BD|nr:PadR family transcriptional regulator [Mycobacterium sp.]HZA10523.1 PadR family transcriptional regulator [Mycobacterium sp.]
MAYQLTSLGISVLALLRERPMHGYEMFQMLTARHEARILKVRPGSLYHVVYRLADEKLIRPVGIGRNGNRPERTTYELTDAGAEALTERVRELVATPVNEFPRFVVALAEIHNLNFDTAVDAVQRRIAALEASVAEMTALREAATAPAIYLVALDYLLATTEAKVEWLRQFVESLRSGRLQWRAAMEPETIKVS